MQISTTLSNPYSLLPKSLAPITPSSSADMGDTQPAPTASAPSSTPPAESAGSKAAQAFLDYMKETPAQKFEDAWLASHHLTRQALSAMTPEKRQAILKQMAEDLKTQTEQATNNKLRGKTNILV